MSREQAEGGGGLYTGVGLETWDLDACGEISWEGCTCKKRPLLVFLRLPPPTPNLQVCMGRQLEPPWVSSILEAPGLPPLGPRHLAATPTPASGLPFLPPQFSASAAPRLAGVWGF